IHISTVINKKKKEAKKKKDYGYWFINKNKIGHFYFGNNRTFLNWLDNNLHHLTTLRIRMTSGQI
ncbi:MAG: hypothetical protein ABIH85_01955, partial [Candidatus Omnitrophota bacterium]